MNQPINLEAFFADVDTRSREERELAETNESIAFLRGVIVGGFSALITVSIAWGVWRLFHG